MQHEFPGEALALEDGQHQGLANAQLGTHDGVQKREKSHVPHEYPFLSK